MRVTFPLATLLSASLLSGLALAQVPPASSTVEVPPAADAAVPVPAPVAPQLTREDLEAWLDGFIPYALGRGNIAGGIVVVVKDGQVLLQKGYGYADVEKKLPVDPEQTLFRPGSISKLFTWTAVMQLVERGKIDLDADINQYLDFKIPPGPDGEPITMRNLMTHTSGFEEAGQGADLRGPGAHQDDRGNAEELGARAHLQGRHDARLLELRHCPRGLHRRAGVGPVVRRLPRPEHLRAARHAALLFRQPLPKALKAGHGAGLRGCERQAEGLRAHQPLAGGLARGDRRRHGASS